MRRSGLLLILLLVLAFSLGAWVDPRVQRVSERYSGNVFEVVLGEGRRMFANHFAVKADSYLHSGFYPSIFDQAAAAEAREKSEQAKTNAAPRKLTAESEHTGESEHAADAEHAHDAGHAHENGEESCPECHKCDTTFMGQPQDWIDRLGRNFIVTQHTHLEDGKAREILPWLKLAVELDPQRVETYAVGAYWLRVDQNRPDQAERFLREGLKANPESYVLYFELGQLYYESHRNTQRARNLLEHAYRLWQKNEGIKEEPDRASFLGITVRLGKLELEAGNPQKAIEWLTMAKEHSPSPDALQKQIDEIRAGAAAERN
jgi:tetratricopeptide (TPR) repeat protein